tara:strand:+ start:333 stop:719 length:387 start_codon:yes stop_codon:yes gene_type:complete
MACFWNSIINRLNKDNYFKQINNNIRLIPKHLVLSLKKNNRKTNNIIWQGEELTEKQKDENFEHINSYNIKDIYNGYYCSTFDPFLFLICDLFDISITNIYNNNKIEYINKFKSRYTMILYNNKGHMW